MKFILSILLILLISCSKPSPNAPDSVLNALSKESLKEHLTYISSDEMKGRDTGSPELKKVASFLADKLKSYGYEGLGENGSFLQPFKMIKSKYDFNTLKMSVGKPLNVEHGKNIVIINRRAFNLNYNDQILFAREGVYNDAEKQFNAEDVKDKIVLIYSLSDKTKKKHDKLSGRSIRSFLTDSLGAKGVITILDKKDEGMLPRYARFASRSSLRFENAKMGASTIFISGSLAKSIYRAERKRTFKGRKSFVLKNRLKLELKADSEDVNTQNVVAKLKGTDEKLASQYIAYGAHYDHVGVGHVIEGDSIYNGADDDGSGTVAVLEMAKAFSKAPPRRSVMISFFSGEEKGLLGSKYISENQVVPMDSIVAMFNMDMVGRSGKMVDGKIQDYSGKLVKDDDNTRITLPNEIYVIGADKISRELDTISTNMNNMFVKMDLNYALNDEAHPARIYYRSDHWNFAKHGVPIIFYFDGIHEDYHKPSDTVDKIDFNKIYLVSKLALTTGYHVANKDDRLVID